MADCILIMQVHTGEIGGPSFRYFFLRLGEFWNLQKHLADNWWWIYNGKCRFLP